MNAFPATAIAVLAGIWSSSLPIAETHDGTLMLLGGSEKALARFEKAATACHLNGVSHVVAEAGTGTWFVFQALRRNLTRSH